MSAAFDYAGVQFEKGESADIGADNDVINDGQEGTDTDSGPMPGTPVGPPAAERQEVPAGDFTGDTGDADDKTKIENEIFDIPSQFEIHRLPAPSRREETHRALRQWEGVVESVDGDKFVARLTPVDDSSVDDEIVTLETARVARDDRSLIEPGAVFYWNIGETHTVDGQLRNYSEIRFRRLPKRTKRDFERATEKAADFKAKLFGGKDE